MAVASQLPRPVMAEVAQSVLGLLVLRQQAGPPEPVLDAFIPQLEPLAAALSMHVEGKETADNTRRAQLQHLELADIDVDCWLRHAFYFLRVESEARGGPRAEPAQLLRKATGIDEMSDYVDAYVPDENRYCWDIIKALEHPDYAAALIAVGLPAEWIPKWKAALNKSQEAFNAAGLAREARGSHVTAGQDMEADFSELFFRIRRYIDSRADRRDKAKVAEGKKFIQPLLDALQKAKTDEAARATRRETQKEAAKAPPVQDAPPTRPATSTRPTAATTATAPRSNVVAPRRCRARQVPAA